MDKTNTSVEKASIAKVEESKSKTFFNPVVQPKLNVNKPGDAFETEADRVADQVMSKTAPGNTFFTPAPNMIQREENKEPEDKTGDVLAEGAGVVWENLKLKPGFEAWKEQQTKELKYKLWESQPTEFKAGMITFGLANLGILGSTFALDPGFRKDTIKLFDDKNIALPLSLIPYSEYFGLSSFKYQLPSAANAPYTFETELEFDAWFKLMREKWAIPQIGLSVGVDSSYSEAGGFKPVTGGNVKLKFGGGIINVQGFYNQHLPPTPMLISDPTKGEAPVWMMRSLPGQLEENLPVGSGVFITVDVLRLPELFGAKSEPPPRATTKDDVSRKENNGTGGIAGNAAPAIVNDVLSSGGGAPLEHGTRSFMEDRFGQDFSNVRVHTNDHAADSAKAIDAKAYTSGSNIVFDTGQYNPSSQAGQTLIAHELAHVVQQSGSIQRKENPAPAPAPTPTPSAVASVTEPENDVNATAEKRIREKLEVGNYTAARADLKTFLGTDEPKPTKNWLKDRESLRFLFLRNLPGAVIADVYSPEELELKSSVEAYSIIDAWYHTNEEKQLLYLRNLRLFDRILNYISPFTGEPMKDVVGNLVDIIKAKSYPTSFNNREFDVIHLLAPTVERKFDLYKKYPELFKITVKKFDPFTGIRLSTMEYLTTTKNVDRDQAARIYNQLLYLDEKQRQAFIEVAAFAGKLEADKDAEAYYKNKFEDQYKALPHNWDSAILPWNWPKWDAPFAERLTIDHVALMSTNLNYEDKETRKFGFDRGINTEIDKAKGQTISDANRLINQLKDEATLTDPGRLGLLLAIAVRGYLEDRVTKEVLLPNKEKLTPGLIAVVESYGFIAAKDFKYMYDQGKLVEYTAGQVPYIIGETLFGGSSGSVVGEQRGTFDLLALQATKENKGALGGMKFGKTPVPGEEYYNTTWLENEIKKHKGSDTLLPNLDATKGGDRSGKIFASIRNDIQQANIYASSLAVEGLNFFGGGKLYRSGPGVLQGIAVHLSWSKDTKNANNSIELSVGIDNIQLNNFQMVLAGGKSTIAIGYIGMGGFKLSFSQEKLPAAEGLFIGLLKNADFTLKALLSLVPNVLKLLPFAVLTMTEEFSGAKAHDYKDALGALLQNDFAAIESTLTFTSLTVRNLYNTSGGFMDDFTIEQRDKDNKLVEQKLHLRETTAWTAAAASNIKERLRHIDKSIRLMKASLTGEEGAKLLKDVEEKEAKREELVKTVLDKMRKNESYLTESNQSLQATRELREANEKFEKLFSEEGIKHPEYNQTKFALLNKEKRQLEEDLSYLDKKYATDKQIAEGNDGGAERYEARKRKAAFDAKYRSVDVDLKVSGIDLKGGEYIRDLIVKSLISMGFESPTLEGVEKIKIGEVESSFTASGLGAAAQDKKPGIAIRNVHVPLIKAASLLYKNEKFRIEADSPRLDQVFAEVQIDFVSNPLERDPLKPTRLTVKDVKIEKAMMNGLQLFMDKEVPLVDFKHGVPVELWGIHLWDFDKEVGNVNLTIDDIKAEGTYADKDDAKRTNREISFGINTKEEGPRPKDKKPAIELHYNKKEDSLVTKLNISSAWIPGLLLTSPTYSISSLENVKAVNVKNIEADVKVLFAKPATKDSPERPLTLEINRVYVGEISAQGIKVQMFEDIEAEQADPKKKKARKIQEISLPEKDDVSIKGVEVKGLRVALTDDGPELSTIDKDASIKLGETDLGGIGYQERISKTNILKAFALHQGKFTSLEMSALGRNGRTYTIKEFFKFFGRTRLEGLVAGASYNDGKTSASVGITGKKNVPISVDYFPATNTEREHYKMRLPIARINLPALHFVKDDHEVTIPKFWHKNYMSYMSDVDVKLKAYVETPEDKPVKYEIQLESLDVAETMIYGLQYKNKAEKLEIVFEKSAPLYIPNLYAGGFKYSSSKGFGVFGQEGGFAGAALGDDNIEASFDLIKKTIEGGEFLMQTKGANPALDIDIAYFTYRQDEEGNKTIRLGKVRGNFPNMTIEQTSKKTGITTKYTISSKYKTIQADNVEIKLNADDSKAFDVSGLVAGQISIVSKDTLGTGKTAVDKGSMTINIGAEGLKVKNTNVKLNSDGSKDITLTGVKGGEISAQLLSPTDKGKTSEKNIALPGADRITVDTIIIRIEPDGRKTITLDRPIIRSFDFRMPSDKAGDYFKLAADLQVEGKVVLADGVYNTMAPGSPADAYVVNVPANVPVQILNLRVENKDTSEETPKKEAIPPLTAEQERLLELEKTRDDAKEKLENTRKYIGKEKDLNPYWEMANDALIAAEKAYQEQKSKMTDVAKGEAARSSTKKYLDAVKADAKVTMKIFDTVFTLNVETYKGKNYVQITDELITRLKTVIQSVVSTTVDLPFWKSAEVKRLAKNLNGYLVKAAPQLKKLLIEIEAGRGAEAVVAFLGKTDITTGLLKDDPKMFGLNFNINASWGLDISGYDVFGVPLVEHEPYKHPGGKAGFYDLFGFVEHFGYVSPALVTRSGPFSVERMQRYQNRAYLTDKELDDLSIDQAVFELVAFLKVAFTEEGRKLTQAVKQNIKGVNVVADVAITPQDVINDILAKKKAGKFEFSGGKGTTIDKIHIDGKYRNISEPKAQGTIGTGPEGKGDIIIPGGSYTSQKNDTKVSYDSLSISTLFLSYQEDTYKLSNSLIKLNGLKIAVKKN